MRDYVHSEICAICCTPFEYREGIVHSFEDSDGSIWDICNDCWKLIERVMDQEDFDND